MAPRNEGGGSERFREADFYGLSTIFTIDGLIRDIGRAIFGLISILVLHSKGHRWKRISHDVLFTRDAQGRSIRIDGIEVLLGLSEQIQFASESAAGEARRTRRVHRVLMSGRRLQSA